jgi:hypothetical protein
MKQMGRSFGRRSEDGEKRIRREHYSQAVAGSKPSLEIFAGVRYIHACVIHVVVFVLYCIIFPGRSKPGLLW